MTASERERCDVVASGVPPERVYARGNGFPDPEEAAHVGKPGSDPAGVRPQKFGLPHGDLRTRLGISEQAPLVLYVGRIAAGKGIEHLLAAVSELPTAHLVIAGPDDRHGISTEARRVHTLPMTDEPPRHLYPQADVFVLASAGESFGMVAAEAAAAGTPVIVSDRCGIAGFFEDGEALIVPYERRAVVDAIRRVLSDRDLRERLGRGGPAAARRMSWDHVADVQESIYRTVASRTAAAKPSTDVS